MNQCPCCSNTLLRHWEQKKTYWYCRTCRQEMPNLDIVELVSHYQLKNNELMDKLVAKSTKKSVVYSLKKVNQ